MDKHLISKHWAEMSQQEKEEEIQRVMDALNEAHKAVIKDQIKERINAKIQND